MSSFLKLKKFNITDFETCFGLTIIPKLVQNPFMTDFELYFDRLSNHSE